MYTIKRSEQEALHELSLIAQILETQTTLEKKEFIEAKDSIRKAQYLVNLILDTWSEERTFT